MEFEVKEEGVEEKEEARGDRRWSLILKSKIRGREGEGEVGEEGGGIPFLCWWVWREAQPQQKTQTNNIKRRKKKKEKRKKKRKKKKRDKRKRKKKKIK